MTVPADAEGAPRVLVVDDDDQLLRAIARYLGRRGYAVITAGSGQQALEQLRSSAPALMLLDVKMPGMSGIDVLEVLPQTVDTDLDMAVVMLTGATDAATAAACMQRGAMDYLTKPIELNDLDSAVTRALKRRSDLRQDREASRWLKEEVEKRTKELEWAYQRQEKLTVATLQALVSALEAKSQYLVGHSTRVAAIAAMIANGLGLTDDEVEQVRLAGRLHDIGMIGIKDSIVNKKSNLTEDEYAHIKEHVSIGSRILAPLTHLGAIVDIVRTHHEQWDGGGYPEGLSGEETPLGGRIIGACEIYDALTTLRPYQETLEPDRAVAQMGKLVGKVLDPAVMAAREAAVAQRQVLVFLDEE